MSQGSIQSLFAEMMSLIYERELRLMREFDLSLLEYYTIQIISFTQGATFKEIGQRLALPKSTVTFVADSLERRGLAERQRSRDDRRVWLLRLTEAGRGRVSEIFARKSAYVLPVLGALPEGEAQALVRVMQEVIRQLKAAVRR